MLKKTQGDLEVEIFRSPIRSIIILKSKELRKGLRGFHKPVEYTCFLSCGFGEKI